MQFGDDNAIIQLKKIYMIPMPSLACRGSRASLLQQEETICSPWRRQLAGVRQHVQACSAGGPLCQEKYLVHSSSKPLVGRAAPVVSSRLVGKWTNSDVCSCLPTYTHCWFRDLCPFAEQWPLHFSFPGADRHPCKPLLLTALAATLA